MSFISQTKLRSSPLGIACYNNHLQIAQMLINNGANISYKNSVCDNNYCYYCFHTFKEYLSPQSGNTILHLASMQGHPEVVKLLVQSHANVNVKNNVSTKSPHYYCSLLIYSNSVCTTILKNGHPALFVSG